MLRDDDGVLDRMAANGVAPGAAKAWSAFGVPRFNLYTAESILSLPERGYLLKGVMAPGELSCWWGPPKCGKSFLALHIAYALAQGRSVFGRRVKKCRVLYLACEGRSGLRARLQALVRRWGHAESFTLIAEPIDLWSPAGDTEALAELIAEHRPDLLVVDTINRVMAGGDENSSADMGALIRHLDQLRQSVDGEAPGPHVMTIHHGTKAGGNGPRGHGSLLGAVDASIEVVIEEDGSRVARLDAVKDDPKGSLAFALRVEQLEPDADGDPVTTCTVEEIDASAPKPKASKPLSDTQQGWLRDLADMFVDDGKAKKLVPVEGMDAVLTLTRDEVRQGFRVRGRFTTEPNLPLTNADKVRLSTMLSALKDKGKIGMTADLVWLL